MVVDAPAPEAQVDHPMPHPVRTVLEIATISNELGHPACRQEPQVWPSIEETGRVKPKFQGPNRPGAEATRAGKR